MASNLEDLFLAQLHLLCPDAPEPQQQVKLIEGRRHRIDFYWPSIKHGKIYQVLMSDGDNEMTCIVLPRGVIVEIDGLAKQAGGGKHMMPADYEKLNLLNLQSYCVLRFTGKMLRDDPYTCISQVAQALGVKMRELDT